MSIYRHDPPTSSTIARICIFAVLAGVDLGAWAAAIAIALWVIR